MSRLTGIFLMMTIFHIFSKQNLSFVEYSGNWQWLATTLNPYYEGNGIGHMIDEDRFIRSSHDNWYFGEDGTGDLMSEINLKGLQKRLSECEINLVSFFYGRFNVIVFLQYLHFSLSFGEQISQLLYRCSCENW